MKTSKQLQKRIYLILLISMFFTISSIVAINITKEGQLQAYLMKNYNKQVRPVLDDNKTINVSFSFEINQILDVNDRNQYMTLKVWVRQYWRNELLIWDPKKWNNIKQVKFPRTNVWVPDILLHNHAGVGVAGGIALYMTDIIVDHTGYTSWVSPASLTSSCKLNMRNFPFDRQLCSLVFSSWTEDESKINLIPTDTPLITSNYRKSAQWEILSVKSEIINKKYHCCIHGFTEATFTIKMKRKSLYFTFNIITPCIVLVANIFIGFFLPPDCGERVSLTITILLAVSVFLQFVDVTLPRDSDSIPLLSIFYIVIMAESALSLICTCIVLIIYHHSTDTNPKPIPFWIRAMFISFLAKVLQVERDNEKDNTLYYDPFQDDMVFNYEILEEKNQNTGHNNKAMKKGLGRDLSFNIKSDLLREVQKIRALMLKHISTNEQEELQHEWKYLAKIVDRVFFWMFVAIMLVTGCFILFPAYIEQTQD